jgi:hypothetical protein
MDISRLFEGRKYMWDGAEYISESELTGKEEHYHSLGFEVKSASEGGKYYLFTRRLVTNT